MDFLLATVKRFDGSWDYTLSVELFSEHSYDRIVECLSEIAREVPREHGLFERVKWLEQRVKDNFAGVFEIEVSHVHKNGSLKVVHRT